MLAPTSVERTCVLALVFITATLVAAGPCDIYAMGGTPCVAAHSTTRGLYSSYFGALYQVRRSSDNRTTDIGPRIPGGVADAAIQDRFCTETDCVITTIYDQTGHGNDLRRAPAGSAGPGPGPNGGDLLADATSAPVTLNGEKAYGVFIAPQAGYRNNNPDGTATGDDPEGLYAVLDGTHYNQHCCFDYGNAETDSNDNGQGHMEAIYFGAGDGSGHGVGSGSGPWIMADLENGLFSSAEANSSNPSITFRFVTAVVKGEPNHWAIRGGDASSGSLSTLFDGQRPDGYNPMSKEGAIILGIGGDNSARGEGTFYEGAMTSGFPSDDIENAVQADIVAAQYGV